MSQPIVNPLTYFGFTPTPIPSLETICNVAGKELTNANLWCIFALKVLDNPDDVQAFFEIYGRSVRRSLTFAIPCAMMAIENEPEVEARRLFANVLAVADDDFIAAAAMIEAATKAVEIKEDTASKKAFTAIFEKIVEHHLICIEVVIKMLIFVNKDDINKWLKFTLLDKILWSASRLNDGVMIGSCIGANACEMVVDAMQGKWTNEYCVEAAAIACCQGSFLCTKAVHEYTVRRFINALKNNISSVPTYVFEEWRNTQLVHTLLKHGGRGSIHLARFFRQGL